MPTVTGLTPVQTDPDRRRVEVDGEDRGTLPADRAERLGLEPGRQLTPRELDDLLSEIDRQRAMDGALDYLSYRPRSRREVERHLRRKDFPEDAVRHALARCEELGYVDDLEYAAAHVRDRIRLRPRGKKLLEAELRKKGVERDTAREGIRRAFREEGVTERELLERVAEKKWSSVADEVEEEPMKARRRFRGHLSRRGFPFHLIREVEDGYFGEEFPGGA